VTDSPFVAPYFRSHSSDASLTSRLQIGQIGSAGVWVVVSPVGSIPLRIRLLSTGMAPELPKIELFARQARKGWAVWGNEVAKAV
jgi:hypothetical protein